MIQICVMYCNFMLIYKKSQSLFRFVKFLCCRPAFQTNFVEFPKIRPPLNSSLLSCMTQPPPKASATFCSPWPKATRVAASKANMSYTLHNVGECKEHSHGSMRVNKGSQSIKYNHFQQQSQQTGLGRLPFKSCSDLPENVARSPHACPQQFSIYLHTIYIFAHTGR